MRGVKLIRAFAVESTSMLRRHGLSLPNPEWGRTYYNPNWSKDWRSFDVGKSSETTAGAELLAQTIGGIIQRPPLVGVIRIDGRTFQDIKTGIFGVDPSKGFVKAEFFQIGSLGEISDYDEVVIARAFLTPEWLVRLNAEIGIGQLDDLDSKFYYAGFNEVFRNIERNDRRRR